MEPTESTSGLDLAICTCGEHEYTARDAIDAAIFRGELDVKWKEFLHQEIVPDEIEYSSADVELRQSFLAELILSGELDRMTSDLIVRLAARCAGKELPQDMIAAEKRKFLHRIAVTSEQLPDWLEQLQRDSKWLDEMLAIEAAYAKHCATLLVPEARQRELLALRLPLTRFETEVIEVESIDAAREALFCVREDGMSMEEVATEGGYPYRRADFILEDLPVDAQHRFLSVSSGEVLKSLAHSDGFELCRILKKIEPHPEDPNVKSRIDQRLLDRHFAEL